MTQTHQLEILLAETLDGGMPDHGGFYRGPRLDDIAFLRIYPEILWVEASSDEEAIQTAYRTTNIGTTNWAMRYREAGCRSLSVGDVVIVDGEAAYQILPFTAGELELNEVRMILGPLRPPATSSIEIDQLAKEIVQLGTQYTVLDLPDHEIVWHYHDDGITEDNVDQLVRKVRELQLDVYRYLELTR
jgi:hypothetical protein